MQTLQQCHAETQRHARIGVICYEHASSDAAGTQGVADAWQHGVVQVSSTGTVCNGIAMENSSGVLQVLHSHCAKKGVSLASCQDVRSSAQGLVTT